METEKERNIKEYLVREIDSLRSFNFSETYIKSVVENSKKWVSTGLLGGVNDTFIGRNICKLFDNQLQYNKNYNEDYQTSWKRCSIPLLRRVFDPSFVGYDLVSVQSMRDSQDRIYYLTQEGRLTSSISQAHSRKLNNEWETPEWNYSEENSPTVTYKGQVYTYGLDAESEATSDYANSLRNEFTREIIADLAMNAGKSAVYSYEGVDHLLSLIEGMSAYIAARCYNRDANWIVTSPKIVEILDEYIVPVENLNENRIGVNKIGNLKEKWRIYEDSSAQDGDILLGFKNEKNHYDSGYIYSPYLPALPGFGKDESISTYGKRLINSGYYGTIKIENLTPLSNESSESDELDLVTNEGGE